MFFPLRQADGSASDAAADVNLKLGSESARQWRGRRSGAAAGTTGGDDSSEEGAHPQGQLQGSLQVDQYQEVTVLAPCDSSFNFY